MLYQDPVTGALHEAPDGQLYESDFADYPYQVGEPVFDGLGNPVGFLPFLPKIASLASSLLPKASGLVGNIMGGGAPPVGGLVRNILGGGAPPSPMAALQQAAAIPAAAAALPAVAGALMPPGPFTPPGWIPRPNPYTGLRGRRMYMRCAMWPGAPGLVPAIAAQMPGQLPAAAAAAIPAAASAAAQTAARMGFRRRRRRR